MHSAQWESSLDSSPNDQTAYFPHEMDSEPPQHPAPKYEIVIPRYRRPGEPEHYRLTAARLGATKREPSTIPIHFWFRTRYVSALAARLSDLHPHVLDLHICPSTVASFVRSFIRLLPLPVSAQSWIRGVLLPEWFLPDKLVLKQQKPREEDDEDGDEIMAELFDTEVKAYDQLRPLQGAVIPTCYGRLRYNGKRALLLERLGGVSLSDPEGATLKLEEVSSLLQPCYRALHAFGVHHSDPHLSNFQLVTNAGEKSIMVLDLETAEFDLSGDRRAFFMMTSIGFLMDQYRNMQAYYRQDGLLEAAT